MSGPSFPGLVHVSVPAGEVAEPSWVSSCRYLGITMTWEVKVQFDQ